jgi:hypothetical protein
MSRFACQVSFLPLSGAHPADIPPDLPGKQSSVRKPDQSQGFTSLDPQLRPPVAGEGRMIR